MSNPQETVAVQFSATMDHVRDVPLGLSWKEIAASKLRGQAALREAETNAKTVLVVTRTSVESALGRSISVKTTVFQELAAAALLVMSFYKDSAPK